MFNLFVWFLLILFFSRFIYFSCKWCFCLCSFAPDCFFYSFWSRSYDNDDEPHIRMIANDIQKADWQKKKMSNFEPSISWENVGGTEMKWNFTFSLSFFFRNTQKKSLRKQESVPAVFHCGHSMVWTDEDRADLPMRAPWNFQSCCDCVLAGIVSIFLYVLFCLVGTFLPSAERVHTNV